jgi:hypothetical protein
MLWTTIASQCSHWDEANEIPGYHVSTCLERHQLAQKEKAPRSSALITQDQTLQHRLSRDLPLNTM